MIRRAEGRSAALGRAQAQLAGSRAAARGAQEHSGNRPVHLAVKNSSDSCLSIHLASDLSSISGTSPQTRRKEMDDERSMEPLMLSRPPGRFLKQKPLGTKDGGTTGLHLTAKTDPSTASRSSAVLRKLAQIESKIRSRKVRLETSEISQELSEEELFWSKSSQDPVQGVEVRRGGLGSPKRETGPKENVIPVSDRNVPLGDRAGPDSEEDGEVHFLGGLWKYEKELSGLSLGGKSFLKSQIKSPPKTPSPPSLRSPLPARNYQKRLSHRTPSPPSRNTPRLSRAASGLSLSSLKDSGPDASSPVSSIFPSGRSLSGRSVIRSLDELFSEADDTHSSSSSDFRVNVLSLDDLAPSMVSQEEEPKIKAKTVQAAGESSKEQATALFPVTTPSTFKASNATMEKTATVEEDEEVEDLGETEISEQLNGSSAEHSSRKPESSISAEYSDDFEPSVSEEMESQYSSEESQGSSSSSVHSRPSSLSSVSSSPAGKRSTKPLRIMVKEAAVQTSCSSLTYHWLQTEAAATLGQTAGGSAVVAPPIASHVVSLDTVEALTTYSPAVYALNDLLKQNVLLIQQFVEFSRHLHNSVVASLEEEEFHYHTLEEAKAYIDHNKPPSLTLEQALQELEQQGQMAF
ncbi:uncharacterized protein C19orf44 homolog [Tiliqua scincoides]|uniref:uncharacterized protein C19orf44 homolog n=1 Tax=Tiliqua scincoides TaxID=71010 RepID=UPI003462FF48